MRRRCMCQSPLRLRRPTISRNVCSGALRQTATLQERHCALSAQSRGGCGMCTRAIIECARVRRSAVECAREDRNNTFVLLLSVCIVASRIEPLLARYARAVIGSIVLVVRGTIQNQSVDVGPIKPVLRSPLQVLTRHL